MKNLRSLLKQTFSGSQNLGKLLSANPRPLINGQHKFILLFSPKAACSACTIWYYKTAGLYDTARAFHEFPHRYRVKKYYDSTPYKTARAQATKDFRFIKVIRDPYQRAVSSYRHALATRYLRTEIGKDLGRLVDEENGFSFHEFLDYLSREDMRNTNGHHQVQFHPVEEYVPATDVINVSKQDLFAQLNRLEDDIGIEPTRFAELDWFENVEARRRAHTGERNFENVPNTAFNKRSAKREAWPASEQFLTTEMRAKIRELYDIDFQHYAEHIG